MSDATPTPTTTPRPCILCRRPTTSPDGVCDRHPRRKAGTRGYSYAFTPRDKDTAKRYLLDAIPASLWTAVRARAKREGVSMRALILQLLRDWVER